MPGCYRGSVPRCKVCKCVLPDKFGPLRKWCSEEHRSKGRRKSCREEAKRWQAAPAPDDPPDPQTVLTGESRPYGAAYYRLSCPAVCRGGRRYYPAGEGWRLFPFVSPGVPCAGVYRVTYYGTDRELLGDDEIAIGNSHIDRRVKGDTRKKID